WHREHPVRGGLDPYDDYLFGAQSFSSVGKGAIEEAILGRYELVNTELGLGGKLISHWEWNPNQAVKWQIRMEFDPAYEMMPVRVQVKNLLWENDFQDTRITWKKSGKTLLPYRFELAFGSRSNRIDLTECTFRCYWLVGDEIPDKFFEADNPLVPLLDHFEIPHSRRVGKEVIPVQHEYPEDLFKTEKAPK
ncbi:MAG: hypothetical protein MI861_22575, partial [Pirellulales bacterium]|nr:hypothetical protein [Pirellulales bacterium]